MYSNEGGKPMKQTEFIDLSRYYLLDFPETVVKEIVNYY